MKTKILLLLISLSFFSAKLFATEVKKHIEVPKEDEVIVVGRVHFTSDMEKKFLFDTFEISDDKRNYPDIYVLPFIPNTEGNRIQSYSKKTIEKFNDNAWGINNSYFFVKYKLGKDRTLIFSNVVLFIGASYYLPVKLPLNFKIKVPVDEKFVYLGDFYYSAKGYEFEISGRVENEFDAAQKALDNVTKINQKLYNVKIEPITEMDLYNHTNKFYYDTIETKYDEWYKNIHKIIDFNEQIEKK